MSRLTFILHKGKKKKYVPKTHAINAPRGSGKTTRLIEECKRHNGLLVVNTYDQYRRLVDNHLIDRNNVVCADNLQAHLRGRHEVELYIDDADLLFYRMFGRQARIAAMSMSVEATSEEE